MKFHLEGPITIRTISEIAKVEDYIKMDTNVNNGTTMKKVSTDLFTIVIFIASPTVLNQNHRYGGLLEENYTQRYSEQ